MQVTLIPNRAAVIDALQFPPTSQLSLLGGLAVNRCSSCRLLISDGGGNCMQPHARQTGFRGWN